MNKSDLNKFWEDYYGVVNLTHHKFSITELQTLGKGLKYCPTPPMYDHGPLKESMDKFFRSASLKLFYQNSEKDHNAITNACPSGFELPELKLPSKFKPTMPTNLEYVYNLVVDEILSHNPTHTGRNMLNAQYHALTSLQKNKDIIIKKADKGSNIVIMTRSDYIIEGERQLSDRKFYRPLKNNPTVKYKKLINGVIDRMYEDGELSDKCYHYLLEGGTRTSIFYLLPKIHKKSCPHLDDLLSPVWAPTEKISQLLDVVLQPYVMKIKSYIKDTGDFIQKLRNIPPVLLDTWLLTVDVVGLYTIIPHSEGIEVINQSYVIIKDPLNETV